tara:strand:- start:1072 stop:1461 length:390 start_codon:yes stop_codon:yes gene_type:complete
MLAVGKRGELLAAEKLIEHGWDIALPIDSSVFDLIALKENRRWRIQVKSTLQKHSYENNSPHYQFQLAKGKSYKHKYQKGELDFFICVALDARRFWVFPFGALDQFTVKIYDSNSRFREYENAWELLEK